MNIYWSMFLAAVMFGAGWQVQDWRKSVEIESIKAQQSTDRANVAEQAVTDLVEGTNKMITAATELKGIKLNLSGKLEAISKDLKNAQVTTPLPADCRPDGVRMQHLQAAVNAANDAAAGQ